MDPKLKGVGKVVVHASNDAPTAHAAGYTVKWTTGLTFRNSTDTAALCIYVTGKDPRTSGLHLDREAAHELAAGLQIEASKAGQCVQIDNHSHQSEQLWQRFPEADAVKLAAWVTGALP